MQLIETNLYQKNKIAQTYEEIQQTIGTLVHIIFYILHNQSHIKSRFTKQATAYKSSSYIET